MESKNNPESAYWRHNWHSLQPASLPPYKWNAEAIAPLVVPARRSQQLASLPPARNFWKSSALASIRIPHALFVPALIRELLLLLLGVLIIEPHYRTRCTVLVRILSLLVCYTVIQLNELDYQLGRVLTSDFCLGA